MGTLISATSPSEGFFSLKSEKAEKRKLDEKSEIEKRAEAYNRQAVELFEAGHFEEAQELWEKALQVLESQELNPIVDEEAIFADHSEPITAENANRTYETAVSLFKNKRYVASMKLFKRIEALVPDFKATRNYITILDHKIKVAKQGLSGRNLEENAQARRAEREEWERILEESKIELENKLAEQADPIYQEALGYYKARKFKLAKDYFEEVRGIFPEYKDTKKYLARINRDIREEEERILEEKRQREILERKKEKEEWARIIRESEQELRKKLIEQVDPIYVSALHYYKKRDFEMAKGHFSEVEELLPDYKSTKEYLARIDKDIETEKRLKQKERAQELEREKRRELLAQQREEERRKELQEAKDKERLERFKMEAKARRLEREEWLETIRESEEERQKKLEEQARYVYKEALDYFKKRHFEQAKADFLEVRRIYPDYKSTEKYLARIDADIAEEKGRRIEEQQREYRRKVREKKLAEQKKWEEEEDFRAAEEKRRLEEFERKAMAREQKREEWEKIIRENERERLKRLEAEAEYIYKEALRSYEAGRFEEARADFLEVEEILPNYKSTTQYLTGIEDDILKKEESRRRAKLEDIQKRKEREAMELKRDEERRLVRQREAEARELKRKEGQANAVYKYAVSLYKREDYIQAKDKFMEVDYIYPGYKKTERYLDRIDQDIQKAEDRRLQEQRLAFERQIREQRLAQRREEERIAQLRAAEEERILLKLREEALMREQERKEWEKTLDSIEEEHKKRLKQQADTIYEEALRYYEAGWYELAKDSFEEVDAIWPGYRSLEKYLGRIEDDIRKDRRLRIESEAEIAKRQEWQKELAKKKRVLMQQQSREEERREHMENLKKETASRQLEKEKLKEDMELIEKKHRKKIERRAKVLYRKAVKLYKARKFEDAKVAFLDVEKTLPGYKSTEKYLSRLDVDIENERYAAMHTAEPFSTKYREDGRPIIVGRRGNFASDVSDRRDDETTAEAALLYKEAVKLYKAKDFVRAKMKFIEVESISPGYKGTLDYLQRIDRDIGVNQQLWSNSVYGNGQRKKAVQQALADIEGGISVPGLSYAGSERGVNWEEEIRRQRDALRKQRLEVQQQYDNEFKELYKRAVHSYRNKSYEEAQRLFRHIETMKPGYKKAAAYLKKTEDKLRKQLIIEKQDFVSPSREMQSRDGLIDQVLNDLEPRM